MLYLLCTAHPDLQERIAHAIVISGGEFLALIDVCTQHVVLVRGRREHQLLRKLLFLPELQSILAAAQFGNSTHLVVAQHSPPREQARQRETREEETRGQAESRKQRKTTERERKERKGTRQSTEHRAQSTEHREQSTEHRTQSTESTEHRAHRAGEAPARSLESRPLAPGHQTYLV